MPKHPFPGAKSLTATLASDRPKSEFLGFAPPTSNTTYTPNQFFDVCLPHNSRGVVRLVGFLIRKTLGWCDHDGNPQQEQIQVSYGDLVEKAGISRDMLRLATDEAIKAGFIECVRRGQPSRPHESPVSALYQLRWDSGSEYITDPKRFSGFFEREGNRTDIPNQFFDHVIPNEPLSVIKVVGSIIRLSIGFQARRGTRRQQVALSYRHIQNYAHISDATTLSKAIEHAAGSNYIVRLEKGLFDPNAGILSRAAVYGLRWADSPLNFSTSQKTRAGEIQDQSENQSGSGQETRAAEQSEKQSGIEITPVNETEKQQQGSVDAENVRQLLVGEGFDKKTASRLARDRSFEEVRNQIAWLPERAPSRNRLGMLRRAIEENWPRSEKLRNSEVFTNSPGAVFAAHYYAGIAGNRGEPLAKPSHSEVQTSEEFLTRLLAMQPEPAKVPAWGRAFAQLVREHETNTRVPSVVLALRLYGDRFFVQFQNLHRETGAQKQAAKRDAHCMKFQAAWFAFLAEQEVQFRSQSKAEYTRFIESRIKARAEILNGRWPLNAKGRLIRFDRQEARLSDFQRFFGLPDFWTWDTQHNSERLQP